MKRPATMIVFGVALLLLIPCLVAIGIPLLFAGQAGASTCTGDGSAAGAAAPAPTNTAGHGQWDAAAVANAAAIVLTGQQLEVPARGWVIALATAMQESSLHNLANTTVPSSMQIPHEGAAHDHDSVGLFQQRPNPPEGAGSWGTVAELMTPAISATKFYKSLLKISGWQTMALTDAAQKVQVSAYGQAYAKWEDDATDLVAYLLGLPDLTSIGGGGPAAPCGIGALDPAVVGPGGWTQPVHAEIWSGFGPRDGRLHAGVDLGAARNTPIHAATSGVVLWADCDSGTLNSVGSCDRDGSPQARGCGWYVDIWHPGDTATRYCHMVRRPEVSQGTTVTAGQVIGFVGTSGNSSGPHLHFETHVDVPQNGHAQASNATDPIPFMQARGVPLGQ